MATAAPSCTGCWLLGATPGQVAPRCSPEAAIVAVVGVVFGLLVASLATVVPFAIARDEGVVPDGQLWLPPLIAAGVVAADPRRGPRGASAPDAAAVSDVR